MQLSPTLRRRLRYPSCLSWSQISDCSMCRRVLFCRWHKLQFFSVHRVFRLRSHQPQGFRRGHHRSRAPPCCGPPSMDTPNTSSPKSSDRRPQHLRESEISCEQRRDGSLPRDVRIPHRNVGQDSRTPPSTSIARVRNFELAGKGVPKRDLIGNYHYCLVSITLVLFDLVL
jgi:hypothetical protein